MVLYMEEKKKRKSDYENNQKELKRLQAKIKKKMEDSMRDYQE